MSSTTTTTTATADHSCRTTVNNDHLQPLQHSTNDVAQNNIIVHNDALKMFTNEAERSSGMLPGTLDVLEGTESNVSNPPTANTTRTLPIVATTTIGNENNQFALTNHQLFGHGAANQQPMIPTTLTSDSIQQQQQQQQHGQVNAHLLPPPVAVETIVNFNHGYPIYHYPHWPQQVSYPHQYGYPGEAPQMHTNGSTALLAPLSSAENLVPKSYLNPLQKDRMAKRRLARKTLEEMYNRRRKAAIGNGSATTATTSNSLLHDAEDSTANTSMHATTSSALEGVVALQASNNGTSSSASSGRRAYLHESRHRHAMKRPRGPKGRFLTGEELKQYYRDHPDEDPENYSTTKRSKDI